MVPRPLIVRLRNYVGDTLLDVPMLRLLQSNGFELQLFGKGWAASLLAGEGWSVQARAPALRDRVRQLRALRQACRARDTGFDARENALVLPTSFSSALDMRLAGLKAVGYAAEGRSPLLARTWANLRGCHELERTWALACRFIGIEARAPVSIALHSRDSDVARADALLASHELRPGFVVICPFAAGTFEGLNKAWPAFPAFSRALVASGRQVLACPGPGEESIVTEQYPGVTPLNGVDLGTYGALLRRAALTVANDTGPAHLAAAVGTRLLSVLGPTNPAQWAPWGPSVEIVRRWPGWPSVDEVLHACEHGGTSGADLVPPMAAAPAYSR